jgi:hypothetical protein
MCTIWFGKHFKKTAEPGNRRRYNLQTLWHSQPSYLPKRKLFESVRKYMCTFSRTWLHEKFHEFVFMCVLMNQDDHKCWRRNWRLRTATICTLIPRALLDRIMHFTPRILSARTDSNDFTAVIPTIKPVSRMKDWTSMGRSFASALVHAKRHLSKLYLILTHILKPKQIE